MEKDIVKVDIVFGHGGSIQFLALRPTATNLKIRLDKKEIFPLWFSSEHQTYINPEYVQYVNVESFTDVDRVFPTLSNESIYFLGR